MSTSTPAAFWGCVNPPAHAVAVRLGGLWREQGSSLAWDRVCLVEAQADTPWEPGWHCHGNGDNNGSCQAESRKGRDLQQCRGRTRPCQGNTGIPAQCPSCDISCPSSVMAWTAVSTSLLW